MKKQRIRTWRQNTVDMICCVLHERVQFYDRFGSEANRTVLEEINNALRGKQLAPPVVPRTPNTRDVGPKPAAGAGTHKSLVGGKS